MSQVMIEHPIIMNSVCFAWPEPPPSRASLWRHNLPRKHAQAPQNRFAFAAASIPDWGRLSGLAMGREEAVRNLAAQLPGSPAAADLQLAATADDHRAADASAVVSGIASGYASDDACSQPVAAGHSHRTAPAPAVAADDASGPGIPDASVVGILDASVVGIPEASGADNSHRPAGHMADSSSVGMSTPLSGCNAVEAHAELECSLLIEGQ